MKRAAAFLSGLLFGLGLLLAGMADPVKVLAFLDLAGAWDPSLALVMVAAIGASAWPMHWAARREVSLLGSPMRVPTRRSVDRRLVGGSLLFGVGWGIAGICPGPALVLLPTGHWQVIVFVLAMLAGMGLFNVLDNQRGS